MDISKAFDGVCHDGLFYEIKLLGTRGRYCNLIQSFLGNGHQRVFPNGQLSKWSLVEAGVPQSSILCLPLFLVYINDLPRGLRCNAKSFVDDPSLFSKTTSPAISSSHFNENLLNPLSANPTNWSNTRKQFVSNLPTNSLSVFGHFVILTLKRLK